TRFDGPDVFSWKVLDEKPHPAYRSGDWNHRRVRLADGVITCLVNDERVFESADGGLTGGRVGLAKFRDTEATFRGFAVGRELPPALPRAAVADRVATILAAGAADKAADRDLLDRLLAEGDAARAVLTGRAAELGREARRLEDLAGRVHQRVAVAGLADLVAREESEIDLFRAALAIARLDDPNLDTEASVHDLDRLAADVSGRIPADADAAVRLATLNRVLFDELGFHGSRGDYYNRSNSYVNEVLDDREGIPITLSVVYMELARRIGLRMEGVGFPGHFLVRYTPPDGEPCWLDVFDRATPRSRDDLAAWLRAESGEPLDDGHLAVVGPRKILLRMLGNLLGIAGREGKSSDAIRYLDAILAIDPESSRDRAARMVAAVRIGRRDTALEDARWLLEHAPPDIDLEQVQRLLQRLEQEGP
ncbi:MAG: SirB1 family protein, partial [Planctomycetia bacterium]